MLARSDPDPGSLKSWHQAASPVAMGRTSSASWASVAWSSSVGAARVAAMAPTGGPITPWRARTPVMVMASRRGRPRPPSPAGQVG